jgi:hypothetical protein
VNELQTAKQHTISKRMFQIELERKKVFFGQTEVRFLSSRQ